MQEGFLLGEARCHSVENITDSQAAGTREEKKLCEHCACVHVCVCACLYYDEQLLFSTRHSIVRLFPREIQVCLQRDITFTHIPHSLSKYCNMLLTG